jgi:hypothetical protein
MVSFGSQKSRLQTQEFPGLTGTQEGQQVAQALQGIFGGGPGRLGQQLGQELLAPTFGPTTQSEQALIDSIISQTQGETATRGLGPATEGSLAQAIAPTLVEQRQQRVSNLQAALDPQLRGREQDIAGLIGLGQLLMPQVVGGQKTTGFNFGVG